MCIHIYIWSYIGEDNLSFISAAIGLWCCVNKLLFNLFWLLTVFPYPFTCQDWVVRVGTFLVVTCCLFDVCLFWHTVWTSGHEPVTFGGATLFLEAPLQFNKLVEFHGNLSVIAVRRPLDGPCVYLEEDGVVKPGAALRLANCHRQERHGGAMQVNGNLFIHGDLHIRNCSARNGGSLGWNWSHTRKQNCEALTGEIRIITIMPRIVPSNSLVISML